MSVEKETFEPHTELELSDAPILTKPDEILANNQQLRQHMVNTMFNAGLQDPKVARVVLSAMKDSDDQINKTKRLEQDDTNSASDREVALRIAQTSEHLARISGNPFKRVDGNEKSAESEKVVEALPEVTTLPGQTDIGTSTETYSEFMNKFDDSGKLIE